MKLDTAIEIVTTSGELSEPYGNKDYKLAVMLLIEAGKREEEYRLTAPIMNIVLLPGETE